jgi:hypothetical protein
MIHYVVVFQVQKESKWDAVVVMCQRENGYLQVVEKYASPLHYKEPGYYKKNERFPLLPGFP